MTGKYEIELYNNRVHYSLTVERNLTVIQGNSATGKSELIRLLTAYQNNGQSSGITLICEKPCVVIGNYRWKKLISETRQSILFIDEGADFLNTKEFANTVRGSDNYFVLITRESLPQLPYSISEIYGMKLNESNKYHDAKRIYNELYHLYNLRLEENVYPDLILTEDSNAGYELYQAISSVQVLSTHGKSNVLNEIDRYHERKMLVIVDGAAFGPEIARVMGYLRNTGTKAVIYAPESFEYLLLNADLVDHTSKVTVRTYLYADSCNYMSWEEFFSDSLKEYTENTIYRYRKQKLNPVYITEGSLKKITRQLPAYITKVLNGDD